MYSIKLKLIGPHTTDSEFFWNLDFYLSCLYGSQQTWNEDWEIEQLDEGYCIMLNCFEEDSYLQENSTIYANRTRQKMESKYGFKFEFLNCGKHPIYGEIEIAKDFDALVLDNEWYPPLTAFPSLLPVPFYKLPSTYHDGEGYDNLNSWARNYKRVLGLWHNGRVGERWAQNQLQKHDSALSKEGRACCQRIEELTGTPTYYFLLNYRAISNKKDQNRKCPSCGGEWLLENLTQDSRYQFQCIPCRLVSERSKNS